MLLFGARLLGTASAAFAFLVVWVPMTWLGSVRRVFQPRLPRRYHELRDFERDPRLYQLLGVRLAKRLLRCGPLAVFNPGLHLPAEPSPDRLAELDQRMKDAEASHFVLLVAMLGVVITAAARGWWVAAGLTLLFNLLMNGYPVMLQRYNRALLSARFPNELIPGRVPLSPATRAALGTHDAHDQRVARRERGFLTHRELVVDREQPPAAGDEQRP